MTIIEKKENLKNIIDKLSDENLEEVFRYLDDLSKKERNRISIVNTLLEEEKWLFEELAK